METTLKKGQTANVGKYSYQYVDIAQIHDYLESIGARYIQQIKRIDESDYIMTKRCFNDKWEDEWLQGARVVDATLQGVKNPAQERGSALTYARRYSLLMAFGLATEDDDAQSLSKVLEVTQEEADNYTLTFGKHKGKKLSELPTDYIEWLMGNTQDERLLKIIELATGMVMPNEEEQQETLALMNKMNELVRETGTDIEKICEQYGVEDTKSLNIEQLKQVIRVLEKRQKEAE